MVFEIFGKGRHGLLTIAIAAVLDADAVAFGVFQHHDDEVGLSTANRFRFNDVRLFSKLQQGVVVTLID